MNDHADALALGIGCRRGVSVGQIERAVRVALGTRALSDVKRVGTIGDKRDEAALVAFCASHALPLVTFTRDAIATLFSANAQLAHSAAAREYLQVDGVCEPCALLAMPGGTLVVRKQSFDGVTVAIASASSNAQTTSATSTEAHKDKSTR
ncbi:cobalamin biosynthesis protein [Paraburkholderia phosphatilytica]|uniref:cobalamin biosynthesis protein n=1 Tax=Paraburkholderia phosphatilytica TaxID=2282883 RepID=UPI000E50F304|nr:cobalamin biosynthesis protein [Paraburkholderia phosphatilytica]